MLENNELSKESKVKKIIISLFCICLLVFAYCTLNYSDLVAVYAMEKKTEEKVKNMDLALGGEVAGIKLLATGVLVMGVDSEDIELQIGDIILQVNKNQIDTNDKLLELVRASEGKPLGLLINRQGKECIVNVVPKLDSISNQYKLGLFVKDSSAGVGTISFYDKKTGKFAALGHAVTETKENYILPITSGGLTKTNIYSMKKGISKIPGELKGTISKELIGEIVGNTDKGIYGNIYDKKVYEKKPSIEILPKAGIKEGSAKIISTLDDNVPREYEIFIEKVLLTSTGNKNMIIKVTDSKLIEKTGGIIQGMSGSPIIQNGKLVGAVTHVFLNDPARGYGVFIENMIDDLNSME